jgi:hypothetical protein
LGEGADADDEVLLGGDQVRMVHGVAAAGAAAAG